MNIRPVGPDDEQALQHLLESDPGYTERITGYPPGPSDALSLRIGRPDGAPEEAKLVLGGWRGDDLVAVLDLVRGHPDPDRVLVGLLLVHPAHRRLGLGRELLRTVDRHAAEATVARAAIVDANEEVTGFWHALGFRATGETRPYRYGRIESISRILERPLPL